MTGLKNNGIFLTEAYAPEQFKHNTGVGKSADSMGTKESLSIELNSLKFKHLIELEQNIVEGVYHTGLGAVVQAIASKAV